MKLSSADANAKALRRQELVEKFDAGLAAGMTAPEAAAGAGGPLPTLRRWSRRYAAEGFDGLLDKCHRSGRRRTIALNEEERALARALYAKSKSAATALRQLAHDDVCRDEVRDFILKPRQ